jgi:RNA-directed DNA polymerase
MKNQTKYHSLIDKVYALPTLHSAYAKGARKASSPGSDGLSWKMFRAHLHNNLLVLSSNLKCGQYQPTPFRVIKKHTYTHTTIQVCIPSIVDRIVEHAIRLVIEPLFEDAIFFDFTAGYRPGRSRVTALRQACGWYLDGFEWVVNIEIDRLAESVDHSSLLSILATYIADGKLLRLIEQDWQQQEGLPNGSALTTFLCNIYLHGIDTLLQNEKVVRFSNIYALFSRTYAEAEQVFTTVENILRAYHLPIKKETTGIIHQPHIENLFLFDGLLDKNSRGASNVSFE